MSLNDSDIKRVIDFVKKEPRTVQDVARLIDRSWVTADSYLKDLQERTGLIFVKTFRKGTPGALKVVFFNSAESLASDELKELLFNKIKNGRRKSDFDFMDAFQYINSDKKNARIYNYNEQSRSTTDPLIPLFQRAQNNLYVFSGNLSFINKIEGKRKIISIMEELVKRKVHIKILARINIATVKNIEQLNQLMVKYHGFIEIKHCYQPLRGFIVDDSIARFSNYELLKTYKDGELNKDSQIVYELTDAEWVEWFQKVFWNLFRSSIDYTARLNELKKIH